MVRLPGLGPPLEHPSLPTNCRLAGIATFFRSAATLFALCDKSRYRSSNAGLSVIGAQRLT